MKGLLKRHFDSTRVRPGPSKNAADLAHASDCQWTTLTLDSLPYDILLEILRWCRYLSWDSLRSISAVSRHLRSMTLPLLFRTKNVEVGHNASEEFLRSRHLLCHVRTLRIGFNPKRKSFSNKFLFPVLRDLSRVSILEVHEEKLASIHWINRLLQLENLESLHLNFRVFWDSPGKRKGLQFSGRPKLRRLQYTCPYFRPAGAGSEEAQTELLTKLVLHCSTTLEHLEVPPRVVLWQDIEDVEFPRLQVLIARGRVTQGFLPFFALVSRAAQLRSLDIQFISGSKQIPVEWKSLEQAVVDLSRLKVFRMGSCLLHQCIFQYLPSGLQELSLVYYPHPVVPPLKPLGSHLHDVILDRTALLQLLKALNLQDLKTLEVTVQGPLDCAFLEELSGMFSTLVELEIHRYDARGAFSRNNVPPMDLFGTSLRNARQLKELRLNLTFEDAWDREAWPFRDAAALTQRAAAIVSKLPRFANQLVEVLPTLDRVLFLMPYGRDLVHHRWVCFDREYGAAENGRVACVRFDADNRLSEVRRFSRGELSEDDNLHFGWW